MLGALRAVAIRLMAGIFRSHLVHNKKRSLGKRKMVDMDGLLTTDELAD